MPNPTLPGSPPTQQRITVAQPAAGSEWSVTVPANTWWRLLCAVGTLTTSATVAARWPGIRFEDGSANRLAAISDAVNAGGVPASIVQVVGWGTAHTYDSSGWMGLAGVTAMVETGEGVYLPGYVFGSSTAGLQVGDQYSAIEILVEQWAASPLWDGGTVLLF